VIKVSAHHPSLAVLGSLTIDDIALNGRKKRGPGGAAWYVSITSASLGAHVDVISRIGMDYPQRNLAWLKGNSLAVRNVRWEPGKTCHFELNYEGGLRTMRLLQRGAVLSPGDLNGYWDGVHIGPVFGEVPISLVRDCKRCANVISMDLQGFVRESDSAGMIFLRPATLKGVLRFVDLLKATSKEVLVQTGASGLASAISRILRHGPRWLVVTLGRKGAILAEKEGHTLKIPAYPETSLRDPTGAGDALVGGWLSTFAATGDSLWAMCIGTAVASLLVRRSGLARFRWSDVELLRRAVWVRERIRPYA